MTADDLGLLGPHALPSLVEMKVFDDLIKVSIEVAPTVTDQPNAESQSRNAQENRGPDADAFQQRQRLAVLRQPVADLGHTQVKSFSKQEAYRADDNRNRHCPRYQPAVARCAAHEIEIIVRDEGLGIANEVMHDLFLPHVSTGSSGLGLHIVETIVKQEGGCVRAANRTDGRGAEFFITLPFPSRAIPARAS